MSAKPLGGVSGLLWDICFDHLFLMQENMRKAMLTVDRCSSLHFLFFTEFFFNHRLLLKKVYFLHSTFLMRQAIPLTFVIHFFQERYIKIFQNCVIVCTQWVYFLFILIYLCFILHSQRTSVKLSFHRKILKYTEQHKCLKLALLWNCALSVCAGQDKALRRALYIEGQAHICCE